MAAAAWRYGGLVGGCGWSAGEGEVEHLAGRPGQEVRLHPGQVNLLDPQASQLLTVKADLNKQNKHHLVPLKDLLEAGHVFLSR